MLVEKENAIHGHSTVSHLVLSCTAVSWPRVHVWPVGRTRWHQPIWFRICYFSCLAIFPAKLFRFLMFDFQFILIWYDPSLCFCIYFGCYNVVKSILHYRKTVEDLLLFILAGCGCIFLSYSVCKKRFSNSLACLLLPIKIAEWVL